MSGLTRDEYCSRFVEYMTREAGFQVFDDGVLVSDYAEKTAKNYWQNCLDNTPEEAAEADMDCWEESD